MPPSRSATASGANSTRPGRCGGARPTNRERQTFWPSGRKRLFEQFEGGVVALGRSFAQSGAIVPYEPWEQEPRFRGGLPGLLTHIGQRVRYPAAAQDANVEGRVFVRLEIDTLGAVVRASLGRGVHPALDAEALRVTRDLQFEQPARAGGRAVPGTLLVPVTFRLK